MSTRPNNPRAFAEVVSIDVWRTPYEGGSAEADLHIDVGFFTGRIGGDELRNSPVRFRMSLRRAEIFVMRDQGKVIEIPPASVARQMPVSSKTKTTMTQSSSAKGGVKASLNAGKPKLDADVEAKASVELTRRMEKDEEVGEMFIAHRKLPDDGGYVFTIAPRNSGVLEGMAWDPSIPRMALRDTNPARRRGEAPEITVQIRCKREDLVIESVRIVDPNVWHGGKLSRNKMIAVEQYIKAEILAMGLPCGDLSEDFATIILADAVSAKS